MRVRAKFVGFVPRLKLLIGAFKIDMFGGIPVEVYVHCHLFEGILGECSSWCEVGLCALVGARTSAMMAFPCG